MWFIFSKNSLWVTKKWMHVGSKSNSIIIITGTQWYQGKRVVLTLILVGICMHLQRKSTSPGSRPPPCPLRVFSSPAPPPSLPHPRSNRAAFGDFLQAHPDVPGSHVRQHCADVKPCRQTSAPCPLNSWQDIEGGVCVI